MHCMFPVEPCGPQLVWFDCPPLPGISKRRCHALRCVYLSKSCPPPDEPLVQVIHHRLIGPTLGYIDVLEVFPRHECQEGGA